MVSLSTPEAELGSKALDAVASWQLDADELTLADDDGTVLVRLERDAG